MHGAKLIVFSLLTALGAASHDVDAGDDTARFSASAASGDFVADQGSMPLLAPNASAQETRTSPRGRITGVRAVRTANRSAYAAALPPEIVNAPVGYQQPPSSPLPPQVMSPQGLPPQIVMPANPGNPNCPHKCCKWVKEPYLDWVCDKKPVDVTIYCCEEIGKEPICHKGCDPHTGQCIEITGIKRIMDFVPKCQTWTTMCAYQVVKYRDVKKCCDCGCHCP